MITKITISNTASYEEATSLETEKRINLVYGLNGSGKTTICDYLQSLNSPEFKDCQADGFNPDQQKILVYNRKFIEENFYESSTQAGVFTLAKGNANAKQIIKQATNKQNELQVKLDSIRSNLSAKEKELETLTEQATKETWKIKRKHAGGDRVFYNAGFLDGLQGDSKKLFEYIIGVSIKSINTTLEEIKKDLLDIGEGVDPRDDIQLLSSDKLTKIETHDLFQEEIIGNQNSSVSGLIKQLDNSDWMKQGLGYLGKAGMECPFCQQETLTDELTKAIRNYFDKNYDEKTKKLKRLKQTYQELKDSIDSKYYERDFFDAVQASELTVLFEKLNATLDRNLNKIQTKTKSVSQKIVLESTKAVIDEINNFISDRNDEIDSFNQKIANKDQTIETLKTNFWQVLRNEYDTTISHYDTNKLKLEKEIQKITKSCEVIERQISNQAKRILKAQEQTTNIDQTIEAINLHLKDFGIQSFKIVKYKGDDGDCYRIERDYEPKTPVFQSLSEGEKTVISFLYFVELCKGKESETDLKRKIIVIDDPISSLSHMYIFNVAQLIKKTFLEDLKNQDGGSEYLQCFILTHSLYFFHELVDTNDQKRQQHQSFFRITKASASQISSMKHSEIRNEYEAYWDIVKTATDENMPLVANAMRNIIEHFFGFIEKADSISNAFQSDELADNKFQAFLRYMNRESHTDRINISDYKEFDQGIFQEAFKKVFEASSHIEHYEKYYGN